MKQSIFLLIVGTLFATLSLAQTATFKVLVNKGQNQVKVGDQWQPIKTGSTLKSNEEVKVADNAYLGLIHSSTGRPLELKTAGSYKVATLAGNMTGGTSVLNKYTDFVLSSNAEKKNKLSATGAVHRGGSTTKVFLPQSELAVVYGDEVVIDWHRDKEYNMYVVSLKTIFGDELLNVESNDPVRINLSEAKFANEDNIIVEVYPKGHSEKIPDPPFFIKKLSPHDREKMKNQLNTEMADVMAENTAINKLILAGFYEENKLLIDAGTAYQDAMKLAPDVEEYKEAYHEFLSRHGIK